MTNHAQARIQQRGIPAQAVDVLLSYGKRRRHHGADVYFLDKAARTRVAGSIGRSAFTKLERALNSYIVVNDDGAVITAARRLQRLKF